MFDRDRRIVVDLYNHPTNEELILANAALSFALSSVQSTVDADNSTIASLSTALSTAESTIAEGSTSVSTEVSAAVDAEDTTVAGEISTALQG